MSGRQEIEIIIAVIAIVLDIILLAIERRADKRNKGRN